MILSARCLKQAAGCAAGVRFESGHGEPDASGGRYARGRFGKRKQDSQLRQRRSLCDAAHFAEELTGRFRRDRRPLPAMAINDAAYMTCVGNDFSFDQIFARWVEAFGRPGDVLLAISTSGNSGNVVMAVEKAREAGMKVLALTREGTNKLSEMADVAICAPTAPYSERDSGDPYQGDPYPDRSARGRGDIQRRNGGAVDFPGGALSLSGFPESGSGESNPDRGDGADDRMEDRRRRFLRLRRFSAVPFRCIEIQPIT